MKFYKGLGVILVMVSSVSAYADADALTAAAQKLCGKTKMCLKQDMSDSEEIPPGLEAMMSSMVDEMCGQFKKLAEVHGYEELIEPATACLESMTERSCDELLNAEEETKACKTYQAIADRYQ